MDNLTKIIYEATSLRELAQNDAVHKAYNLYLETLVLPTDLMDKIQLYELITSDNFINVLMSLDVTPAELASYKAQVLQKISGGGSGAEDAFYIFHELFSMVKEKMRAHAQNANYKFLTARNVLVTENVSTLGITNLDSLLRLFTNFRYHRKFSSSPSLVFNAQLAPQAGMNINAVKSRNTLKPGQVFFFKAFPVGPVANLAKQAVQYDTIGLQTEVGMYGELFKLVKYNITPNILCKLATAENVSGFKDFLTQTNMLAEAKEYTFNEEINEETLGVPKNTIWDTVSLISTHKGGEEIKNVFHLLQVEERRQVMFQLLYNLYVFDHLEISQGDLHGGNVLINILPEEADLVYIVNGQQFHFQTKYLVKFFDLDRGMIGKSSTLAIDKNQHVTMNQITNPVREPDSWVNQVYGVTSIYNKNFELTNLITHETHGLLTASVAPRTAFRFDYAGGNPDEAFNSFMADIMPGASPTQTISHQTIKDTYKTLLTQPAQKAEANRIFGVCTPSKYGVGKAIENMTWGAYFDFIKDKDDRLGHIVKSTKEVKNNHLWIPDTVILPKLQMLQHPYFEPFVRNPIQVNVTQRIVYTLDNMIPETTTKVAAFAMAPMPPMAPMAAATSTNMNTRLNNLKRRQPANVEEPEPKRTRRSTRLI